MARADCLGSLDPSLCEALLQGCFGDDINLSEKCLLASAQLALVHPLPAKVTALGCAIAQDPLENQRRCRTTADRAEKPFIAHHSSGMRLLGHPFTTGDDHLSPVSLTEDCKGARLTDQQGYQFSVLLAPISSCHVQQSGLDVLLGLFSNNTATEAYHLIRTSTILLRLRSMVTDLNRLIHARARQICIHMLKVRLGFGKQKKRLILNRSLKMFTGKGLVKSHRSKSLRNISLDCGKLQASGLQLQSYLSLCMGLGRLRYKWCCLTTRRPVQEALQRPFEHLDAVDVMQVDTNGGQPSERQIESAIVATLVDHFNLHFTPDYYY